MFRNRRSCMVRLIQGPVATDDCESDAYMTVAITDLPLLLGPANNTSGLSSISAVRTGPILLVEIFNVHLANSLCIYRKDCASAMSGQH